ncbi:MAG: BrnT family toxin [Gammaproteobacteria bacterium]|nr:BrnT family toxin [Gammaproteobacteria bacterium]
MGRIDAFCYVLVYTIRKSGYRIISARGASRNERETYENYDAST